MPAELRLAMTLRYLAGASYLDVASIYGCADTHVYEQVDMVVNAINSVVGDSKDPYSAPYDAAFTHRMDNLELG
jgi:hypothetical protein